MLPERSLGFLTRVAWLFCLRVSVGIGSSSAWIGVVSDRERVVVACCALGTSVVAPEAALKGAGWRAPRCKCEFQGTNVPGTACAQHSLSVVLRRASVQSEGARLASPRRWRRCLKSKKEYSVSLSGAMFPGGAEMRGTGASRAGVRHDRAA